MPVSNSRLSYTDCFALFERAYEDKVGARYQVPPGDRGSNQYFQMRMHQARSLDRADNKFIHEPGTALHGRSIYDPMVVQLKQDTEGLWWVYVSHTEIPDSAIESLSETEGAAE